MDQKTRKYDKFESVGDEGEDFVQLNSDKKIDSLIISHYNGRMGVVSD